MTCAFLCVQAARGREADVTTPGEILAGSVELDELTKLPASLAGSRGSRRISWIIVQNRATNANGGPNGTNLLVGDAGNQVIELAPGASTMPLPLNDLSDVFARSL